MALSFHSLLAAFCANLAGSASVLPSEIDWVIVGGGASGCTAAAALADGNENVLVLERGPSDTEILSTQSGLTWSEVVVEASEQIRWTDGPWGSVAKVLGGGASLNDGYFFEEEPSFLQEHLGLDDDDLDQYYQSSKWLADNLLTPLPRTDYGEAYAAAAEMAGHGRADFDDVSNVRLKDGAWVVRSLFNLTDPAWPRQTPAKLLHDREHMPNLHVVTKALVSKVNFKNKRAVGVEVFVDGSLQTVAALKGVIMAAGAIYTPQILQVSGIGNKETLSHLSVPPVTYLPVGENFVDRLTYTVQIASRKKIDKYLGYTVAVNTTAGITFESVGGSGIDSQMAIASLGLAPAKNRYAFLMPLMKWLMNETPIGELVDHFSNVLGLVHDPQSRGSVQATSLDVSQPPQVTANYFSAEGDMDKQLANLKANIEIARQDPLSDWRMKSAFGTPNWSGFNSSQLDLLKQAGLNATGGPWGLPEFLNGLLTCEAMGFISVPCPPKDESKWPTFLTDNVLSTYHYFGTAALGSVVESSSFKVKNTEGLYVVDASAIPRATRINPVGTIMTIGHFVGSKLARAGHPSVLV